MSSFHSEIHIKKWKFENKIKLIESKINALLKVLLKIRLLKSKVIY